MTASATSPATAVPRAGTVRLTLLNAMAGDDIERALDRHVEWGLELLDLKDRIFGTGIADLAPAQAERLRALADARRLAVHTLSTQCGGGDADAGEDAFRAEADAALGRVLALVPILRPRQVRLLAAQVRDRAGLCDAIAYLRARQPWLFAWYREAIDRIEAAGAGAIIENEVGGCCVAREDEALDLLAAIGRPRVRLTWDVVNLWQMGTFPSLAAYRRLRPAIGMLHLKGGLAERPGGRLRWRSSLERASWPVLEVVRAAIADGASPVICLNPPHGEAHPDYHWDYAADLAFLRQHLPEIAR